MARARVALVLVVAAIGGAFRAPALSPPPTFTPIDVGLSAIDGSEVRWGDYDGDGDLDLAIHGITAGSRWSRLYRNDGGTFFHDTNTSLFGYNEGPLVFGDFDNDGDLDLVHGGWSGGGTGTRVSRNDGASGFVFLSGAITRGMKGADAVWVDIDNDGDLDLVSVGESYDPPSGDYAQVWRNDKTNFFTLIQDLVGNYLGHVAAADYDNDGDFDLVITGRTVGARIYRNDAGTFTDIAAGLPGLIFSAAAWGDFDNDGDVDLALCGQKLSDGTPHFDIYRNDGGTFTALGAGLPGIYGGEVHWGDYDNDGDPDLLITGQDVSGTPVSRVYRNDGGGVFVDAALGLTGVTGQSSASWGDYDNDGDLDIVLGGQLAGGGGTVRVFRNDSVVANTPPAAPGGLSAVVNGSQITFSWNASTDAETPAAGLTYNLRVGTTPGGQDIMAGMSDPTTGLRRLPQPGNVQSRLSWTLKNLPQGAFYYSVQAVDGAFRGSSWAVESVVTTLPQNPGPPQVASTTPADGNAGVLLFSAVEATFTEGMNQASVEAAFSISPLVPGSFSWSGLTMIFTPSSDLAPSTLYQVTLGAGAQDFGGTPMAAPHTWSFTTGTIVGTPLPPGYLKTLLRLGASPSDRIVGVPHQGNEMGGLWDFLQLAGLGFEHLQQPVPGRAAPMGIIPTTQSPPVWTVLTDADGVWDQDIGDKYVTYSAIYLLVPSLRRAKLAAQYDDELTVWMDGNPTPTLQNQSSSPGFDLPAGVHVLVIKHWENTGSDFFTLKVTHENGSDMTDLRFVVDDLIAPRVASPFPAPASTNVFPDTDIVLQFSEAMDTSVDPATVGSITGGPAAGTWSWTDAATLVWTPSSRFAASTSYTVTIQSARDLRGNLMSAPFSFTFTTGASSTPSIGSVLPGSGYAGGVAPNITISGAGFNQGTPIHPAGALPFGGHYYKCSLQWQGWYQARDACTAAGGHLVTLSNASEDELVWRLGGRFNAWIGFTDAGSQQNWRWDDGEPVGYTNWAAGEPNNWLGQLEDWGVYWWGFQWADTLNGTRPYVCEFDQGSPPSVKLTRAGQADRVATNVRFNGSGIVTFDMDLTGAALGFWNVVLTNPDGGASTVSDGFEVLPPPTVVTNVTSSSPNATYKAGEMIVVMVQFSDPVTVTGAPHLTLETGASDGIASYVSGSGTSTLTFEYTVLSGHYASDLEYVSLAGLSANGGTIRNAFSIDAVLTLAVPGAPGSLSANKNLVIDAASPLPGVVLDGASGPDIDSQASHTTISATWSGFTDPVNGLVGYAWAIGTTPGGTQILDFTSIGLQTMASTSGSNLTLALVEGTPYYVTVRATGGTGLTTVVSSDGVTVAGTDGAPPPAVTGLLGIPGDGYVILEWNPSAAVDIDGYQVWWKSLAQPWTSATRVGPIAGPTVVIPGLLNGVTYHFMVQAVDSSGNESPGTIVAVQPKAAVSINGLGTYPSIQAAANAAVAGDIVEVGPGTFPGSIVLPAGVSLCGFSPKHTVLQGIANSDVVSVGGTFPADPTTTLCDLTITGGLVGIDAGSADVVVRNVVVHHASSHGIAGQADGRLEVVNVTVMSNGGSGLISLSSLVHVRNCILGKNRGFGVKASPGASVTFSLSYANRSGQLSNGAGGVGNTHSRAEFTDESGFDYTEAPSSPTIDAGDPFDPFAMEPAPNGNRINAGAYGNTPWATGGAGGPPPTPGPNSVAVTGGCGSLGLDLLLPALLAWTIFRSRRDRRH